MPQSNTPVPVVKLSTPTPAEASAATPSQSEPPHLTAALAFLARGWCPVALCPADHAGKLPPSHLSTCTRPGKRPPWKWEHLQRSLPTEDVVRSWWAKNPHCNVGVVLGEVSGLVAIDVDDAEGEAELARLSAGDLPRTLSFTTPGGGRRLLYAWPAGVPTRTTSFPTARHPLHLLSTGSLTVMPPSAHAKGGRYAWEQGSDNALSLPAQAPLWLQRALAPQPVRSRKKSQRDDQGGACDRELREEVRRARAWLVKTDPAISGNGGHNQLFKVCCRLVHGFGLDQGEALMVLLANFNDRCQPPWTQQELEHKLHDALHLGESPDMLGARGPSPAEVGPGRTRKQQTEDEPQRSATAYSEPVRAGSVSTKHRASVPMSEIQQKEVEWLWKNWIPLGCVSVLEGRKGTGKSTFSAALAAAITAGLPLPGRRDKAIRDVLWVTAEEDPARAIGPRLAAAGADLGRVHMFGWNTEEACVKELVLPRDLLKLRAEIEARKVSLVVLDPLAGFLSRDCDENSQQDMRGLLQPLALLAAQTGAAILAIRHLRKGKAGCALDQGIGSVAIGAVARVVLRLDRVQGSKWKRALACVASNLGPQPQTLSFEVVAQDASTRVEWGESLPLDAEELAADQGDAGERSALEDARRLLREKLKDGWVPVRAIVVEAKDASVSERTLRSAKAELGVRTRFRREGEERRWEWGPPAEGWPGKN